MKLLFCVTVLCLSLSLSRSSVPIIECTEPNTVPNDCGNDCQDKCPTYPPRACPLYCYQGCFCRYHYSRVDNGTCIPTGDCKVNCPENSSFGCVCNDSCQEVQCVTCNYMCGCNPDYKRIDGICQPKSLCPKTT